ncbi:MAG: Ldh family oxidoreductase [Spirochaetaceae bacterium]|nr:MAG: Ldh family oxidoreductase [Spirochaetaceae bacterium]
MSNKFELPESEIFPWIHALLSSSGLDSVHAEIVADVFLRASRRRLGHHDINDLPGRLANLDNKAIKPRPSITTISEQAALLILDGDQGLGEYCCSIATRHAIDRAQRFGVGICSIRHSNHFLAAWPYAQMGTEAGCMLLVLSNTDPSVTGPGGSEAIIGNNPLGFGAPGKRPMLLDTCLAYSSIGNLAALRDSGSGIPKHWALGPDGQPTTDPAQALAGWRVRPIGEHKGYGLALMVEALTGVLSGGETTSDIQRPGGLGTHSQTVIAINTNAIEGLDHLAEQMHQAGMRLPGEKSIELEETSQREGIQLGARPLQELREWSAKLDVDLPRSLK